MSITEMILLIIVWFGLGCLTTAYFYPESYFIFMFGMTWMFMLIVILLKPVWGKSLNVHNAKDKGDLG
jgi:hypothetical protein